MERERVWLTTAISFTPLKTAQIWFLALKQRENDTETQTHNLKEMSQINHNYIGCTTQSSTNFIETKVKNTIKQRIARKEKTGNKLQLRRLQQSKTAHVS